MKIVIDTEVFFFNATTDYLAYYKNHLIKIDDEKSVMDLLEIISNREQFFEYEKDDIFVQINGKSLSKNILIGELVEEFGTNIKIEPISTFRANKHLKIDNSDFIAKHSLLEEFGDEDDFIYYKSLIREYYASEMLKYNQDYFGDSLFIYADYLIGKYPDKKDAILKIINDKNGIGLYERECNIYPYSWNHKTITLLRDSLSLVKEENEPLEWMKNFLNKKFNKIEMDYYEAADTVLAAHFGIRYDDISSLELILKKIGLEKIENELKRPFNNFYISFYSGNFSCKNYSAVQKSAESILSALGANVVSFSSSDRADGSSLVETAPHIAFKKAGNIMLDAYDSGAEILVVDSKTSHFMMDQNVEKCEELTGRDIKIPVLSLAQIVCLALDFANPDVLGCSYHKIKPTFI